MDPKDLIPILSQLAQQSATQAGPSIPLLLRTNLNASKPLMMTPLSHTPGPSVPNPILTHLQPELTLSLPSGPITYAPYGHPTKDEWPTVATGLGLAALTFMGLGAIIRIPWVVTAMAGFGAYVMWKKLRGEEFKE